MIEIAGAELLTSIFGYWPSFHDAEVVRFCAARTPTFTDGPAVEADVHVFEMTSEVAASGHYVLRRHTLVTLRFTGATEVRMAHFNNQNALMGLWIKDITERQLEGLRYEVGFDGSFGLDAGLLCRDVEVTAVRAWDPEVGAPAA
jgi:hypothetical protein